MSTAATVGLVMTHSDLTTLYSIIKSTTGNSSPTAMALRFPHQDSRLHVNLRVICAGIGLCSPHTGVKDFSLIADTRFLSRTSKSREFREFLSSTL